MENNNIDNREQSQPENQGEQQMNQPQEQGGGGTNTILIVLLIIIVLVIGFFLLGGADTPEDADMSTSTDEETTSIEVDLSGDATTSAGE